MWYVHEIVGGEAEIRARFPTKAEAEAYARQLQAEKPKAIFSVVPSTETAMRMMDEARRKRPPKPP